MMDARFGVDGKRYENRDQRSEEFGQSRFMHGVRAYGLFRRLSRYELARRNLLQTIGLRGGIGLASQGRPWNDKLCWKLL